MFKKIISWIISETPEEAEENYWKIHEMYEKR